MAWGAPRGVADLIAKLRDNTTVGFAVLARDGTVRLGINLLLV